MWNGSQAPDKFEVSDSVLFSPFPQACLLTCLFKDRRCWTRLHRNTEHEMDQGRPAAAKHLLEVHEFESNGEGGDILLSCKECPVPPAKVHLHCDSCHHFLSTWNIIKLHMNYCFTILAIKNYSRTYMSSLHAELVPLRYSSSAPCLRLGYCPDSTPCSSTGRCGTSYAESSADTIRSCPGT